MEVRFGSQHPPFRDLGLFSDCGCFLVGDESKQLLELSSITVGEVGLPEVIFFLTSILCPPVFGEVDVRFPWLHRVEKVDEKPRSSGELKQFTSSWERKVSHRPAVEEKMLSWRSQVFEAGQKSACVQRESGEQVGECGDGQVGLALRDTHVQVLKEIFSSSLVLWLHNHPGNAFPGSGA